MKRFALTAIGNDRPGIVAAVTKVLYDHDCNIEDSSMTTLEDEFAIILIMSAPVSIKLSSIMNDIEKAGNALGLTIHLKEISGMPASQPRPGNYLIVLHGADRTGLIYRTAETLSKKGINITNLETKSIMGSDEKRSYMMLLEIFIQSAKEIPELSRELEALAKALGVTIKLKPVEAYDAL